MCLFKHSTIRVSLGIWAEHSRKTSGVHACCSSSVPLWAKQAFAPTIITAATSALVDAMRVVEGIAIITLARSLSCRVLRSSADMTIPNGETKAGAQQSASLHF